MQMSLGLFLPNNAIIHHPANREGRNRAKSNKVQTVHVASM